MQRRVDLVDQALRLAVDVAGGVGGGYAAEPCAFTHAMAWWASAAMAGGGGHGMGVQN